MYFKIKEEEFQDYRIPLSHMELGTLCTSAAQLVGNKVMNNSNIYLISFDNTNKREDLSLVLLVNLDTGIGKWHTDTTLMVPLKRYKLEIDNVL